VQKETRGIEQSRSSTDLTLLPIKEHQPKENDPGVLKTPRPQSKRMRRRSTLDWANASPSIRQRRLEEDAQAIMMDVFFSLHVDGEDNPIYVSETLNETINPTFATFSLTDRIATITRQDTITVKIWVKGEAKGGFSLHQEIVVNLRYLHFIGKSFESVPNPLPRNCVIFSLTDGLYTVPSSRDRFVDSSWLDSRLATSPKVQSTSSYDALMRLSTLDACIQDALATRSMVEAEINSILEEHKDSTTTIRSVAPMKEQLSAVKSAIETERRRLESVRKRRDGLKASISARGLAMSNYIQVQLDQRAGMHAEQESIGGKRSDLERIAKETHGQCRRICEDILKIYPIDPIPGKSLSFTIRSLALPNTLDLDDGDSPTVAAALGHVAQVVHMLSAYLSKPLPYPLNPRGSTSTVTDLVSGTTGETIYPLFSRGVARFRFEYGVFLLNKDIELLSNHIGLKVMDLRHTLPNLKYLLYVATAGTGELPARKAGGMRAFLRGTKGDGSVQSSRRGSDASSVGHGLVGRFLRRELGDEGGKKETGQREQRRSPENVNGTTLLTGPTFGKHKASNLREGLMK
jgi:UV radiation resistance-associated gene protein